MITTKGQIIDINDKTEWILFNRLINKVHPADLLSLTDSIIQFPNFLFVISFFVMIFPDVDLKTKFIIPASLYFCGQIIVNLRYGLIIFRMLNAPLLYFQKFSFILMAGTIITSFLILDMWTLMIIPSYLLALFLSVMILTHNDRKYYRDHWGKKTGSFQVYKNNAYILAYKYYAAEFNLSSSTTPTNEEINNKDWLKPYEFMRVHWKEIEKHFNKKARTYWRVYLNI